MASNSSIIGAFTQTAADLLQGLNSMLGWARGGPAPVDAQGTPTHELTDLGSALNSWRTGYFKSLVVDGRPITNAEILLLGQRSFHFGVGPAVVDIRALIGDAAVGFAMILSPAQGGGGGGGGGSGAFRALGSSAATSGSHSGFGGGSGGNGYYGGPFDLVVPVRPRVPITLTLGAAGGVGGGGAGGTARAATVGGTLQQSSSQNGGNGGNGVAGGSSILAIGGQREIFAGGRGGAGGRGARGPYPAGDLSTWFGRPGPGQQSGGLGTRIQPYSRSHMPEWMLQTGIHAPHNQSDNIAFGVKPIDVLAQNWDLQSFPDSEPYGIAGGVAHGDGGGGTPAGGAAPGGHGSGGAGGAGGAAVGSNGAPGAAGTAGRNAWYVLLSWTDTA